MILPSFITSPKPILSLVKDCVLVGRTSTDTDPLESDLVISLESEKVEFFLVRGIFLRRAEKAEVSVSHGLVEEEEKEGLMIFLHSCRKSFRLPCKANSMIRQSGPSKSV